ncbi:MAG: general secretion pathway protein GspE [Desulfuromonas sp.]|nr:MAG: general secretion pathway protein GspE [Desulfuromonas sp.]
MASKLGDMLVIEGLITPEELEEALRYQVIYGGKLGTNLIEMGLVDEGDISLALSRKLGVPYVDTEQLMSLPSGTLKLIPQELVEKYQVIPLRLDKNKLSLVMLNPVDLAAIDDIAFRTGFVIRPLVAPEVRMVMALEKFYGMKRELRYIQAINAVSEPREKRNKDKPKGNAPDPRMAELADLDLAEIDDVFELSEVELIEEEVIDAEVIDSYSLEHTFDQLAEAKDRDQIASTLIQYLGQEYTNCALFMVKGRIASGWTTVHEGIYNDEFPQFQFSLDHPSVISMIEENRSFFLGPIPDTPQNRNWLTPVKGEVGKPAILVPIMMLGRVVAILFAQGRDDLAGHLSELQVLGSKAAMAFDILILKSKIRIG